MKSLPKHTSRGFSLVETVMALAIVAVSVLTLVALVPSGIEDLRRSSLKQAEARIIQSVVSTYQMASWGSPDPSKAAAELKKWERDMYFDIKGTMLPAANTVNHAITARISVQPDMPTLAGDKSPTQHLRRLRIQISDQFYRPDAFANPNFYKERSALIANTEQTKMY